MIPGRQSSNPAKPASYRLILSLAIRGRPERARRRYLWDQRAAAADAGRSGGAGQHSADRDEMPTNGDDAQRSESGRARCWGCARTGAARRPSRRARRAPRPHQAHASAYLVDGGAVRERLCDGHPLGDEHPIGQGVLDREQCDGVPGQLLGWDRVSDPVAPYWPKRASSDRQECRGVNADGSCGGSRQDRMSISTPRPWHQTWCEMAASAGDR